mmetsp:Transcript_144812/g.204916  ORF Transcript_144812/g.204916 Transcript_144812/m.204916 type:complete len:307 (+) Transcript_144812:415-1335(+)
MRHVLLGGGDAEAFGLHPGVRGHGIRLAGHMRVRALPGEGVMKPLGEKPSVQRHGSAVMARNLMQPPLEVCRQLPRCRDSRRRQLLHQLHQLIRISIRCGHLAFQMPEERLTLVNAAHRVDAGGRDTVGVRVHVVGHEHGLVGRVRLIKSTELTKIVHAFGELPIPVQGGTIEILEQHSAGVGMLNLHQKAFEVVALGILPTSIALTDLLHDLSRSTEAEVTLKEIRVVAAAGQACANLNRELLRVLPSWVRLENCLALGGYGTRANVLRAQEEDGHVRVDEILELELVHPRLLRVVVCLVMDEVL